MISSKDFTLQRGVYSYKGEGFWRVCAYCSGPSLTMENIDTGERINFGTSGQIMDEFKLDNHFFWDQASEDIIPVTPYGSKVYAERIKEKFRNIDPKQAYDKAKRIFEVDILQAIQRFQERSGCYVTSISTDAYIHQSVKALGRFVDGISIREIHIETTIDKLQEPINGKTEETQEG